MVTILVVGIFAAILTPSFINWMNSRRIEDITIQVMGALKEAQSEAQKGSRACAVEINLTTITATPAGCLSTGTKDLTKLGIAVLSNNQSGTNLATNLGSPARITFSHKGNASLASPVPEGVITVFQQGGGGNNRCIAIASGVGIMRQGKYVGSDPTNPNASDCETMES